MSSISRRRTVLRAALWLQQWFVFMLCPGFMVACSQLDPADQSADDTRLLSFHGLYRPFLPLEIFVHNDNSLTWRDPPDSAGIGRICGAESEITCITLNGLWKFAIPNAVVADARIGQSWTFEGIEFEIFDIIEYPVISRKSEILVVKSGNTSTGWILFHFDTQTGIEAITHVHSSWEPANREQYFIPVIEVDVRER